MKRIFTVALGVALCTLATAASARPNDAQPGAFGEGRRHSLGHDSQYSRPGSYRRSARNKHNHRHATSRWDRRHASPHSQRQHARRSVHPTPLTQRGVTSYARAGTSRNCLTSAARALLGRIEAQFGQLQIVSTCRPGAVIAGSGRPSRHASGNAIDFNAPNGRKAEMVRWLVANHRSGGTMTYADMGHIHVDIGHRFVSLGSISGR